MIIGVEPNQINHLYLQADKGGKIQKLYVRYNDGYVQTVTPEELGVTTLEFAKEISKWFKAMNVSKERNRDYSVALATDKIFAELDSALERQANKDNYDFELDVPEETKTLNLRINKNLFKRTKKEEKKEDESSFELDANENAKLNPKHAAVAGGIVALAIAIGACSGLTKDLKTSVNDASSIESSIEDENSVVEENFEEQTTVVEKPSMEGKDYEYYVTYAPVDLQKDTMVKYHDYVMNFNNSEGWMFSELTPEIKEELEKMSITLDGDEALFGFTAEEVNALNLVFGTHTNEEYTKLTNGEYIDITKVMSSTESDMNKAIRKVIVYYLNSDNAHIGIENVVNFTDSEKEQIKKFEDMFQEYKDLLNEKKEKEAESKMKEIKTAVLEYAHSQDIDVNNAKPYILRTLVSAFSVYSVSYGYQDTITLNLQDNTTGKPVDKDIKTDLWDEITMRDLILGYKECKDEHGVVYQDGFSEIDFLNRLDIDSKKYSLIISDDGVSIADTYVGGLENKLSGANDYMEKLRTENSATDALVTASIENANVSNNSELDTLTESSYDQEVVLEMINSDLVKEHRYPSNLNFFTSIYSKFTKQVIAFKDALYGKMSGTKVSENNGKKQEKVVKTIPGKTTYIPGTTTTYTWTESWTETYTDTRTEKRPVSEEEIAAEDAANRAKAVEEASKTTVTDGATGKQKETTYQDIYNKEVNDKTNGKTNLDTNLDNDDQTNKNDPLVDKVEKWAQEDAKQIEEEHKKAAEGAKESYVDESGNTHYISGGDEHTYEEYKNVETATESEAEEYNRRLREQQAQQTPAPAPAPVVEPTPTPEPAPAPVVEDNTAGSGSYTTEDPTTNDDSFAPAYEEEIDAIIESMANDTSVEATEGMSK